MVNFYKSLVCFYCRLCNIMILTTVVSGTVQDQRAHHCSGVQDQCARKYKYVEKM